MISVVHVSKVPMTGVWSVMSGLACKQLESGLVRPHFAVFYNDAWSERYMLEADSLQWPVFRQKFPSSSGLYLTLVLSHQLWKWVELIGHRNPEDSIVVHFHDGYIAGIFLPVPSSLASRVVCITTIHGAHETSGLQNPVKRMIYRVLMRRVLRSCTFFTTVDSPSKKVLQRYFGMEPQHVITVPNGIVLTNASQSNRSALIQRSPGESLAGFVGVLNDSKGWRIAVEAVRLARQNGAHCHLVLAGLGKDEDSVQAVASRYDFVTYLGYVERANRSLIPYLDTLLLPSAGEGQPMVVLEAMAQGVPVVATAVGAIPDMITSGVNGILAERTPAAFADAICRLEDSAFKRSLGEAAAGTVKKRFDMSAIAEQYRKLYEEAIQLHQP